MIKWFCMQQILSTIILTKNEENDIVDCIETLNFADEIIIIDDYSTDRTLDVVKDLNRKNIHCYKRKLENDFSAQRNFGLSKAKGIWILFVDADERISKELGREIINKISDQNLKESGFFIKRLDEIWNRRLEYGETGNIRLLRLAKRNSGAWSGRVHEKWQINGITSTLKNEIIHYPHKNLRNFLSEINYYSTLRAQELHDLNRRTTIYQITGYPIVKCIYNIKNSKCILEKELYKEV